MQIFSAVFTLVAAIGFHSASSAVVRAPGNNCYGYPEWGGLASRYHVNTLGDSLGNWGQGLLDNLRGECGVITNWGADLHGPGVSASFLTSTLCSTNNIHNAIWLSSNPNARLDIQCTYSNDGSAQNIIDETRKTGAVIASAVNG